MASNQQRTRHSSRVNDWRHATTLRERMAYLFDNPTKADVIFICKHNQRFFAHRLIITSGSHAFDEMLSYSSHSPEKWRVGSEEGKSTIEVNECDVKHMKPIIKYLYTDQLDIQDNNAAEIILWSKKFKVKSVSDRAVEYIASKINGINCLQWWQRLTTNEFASEETDLINRCLHLIAMNAKNRFLEPLFLELSIDQLIVLFSRIDLNISEFELFKAAIHWADMRCKRRGHDVRLEQNLRQALGMAFDLIRFPTMSSYEFGLIITQYRNIFTREEVNSLIAYINSGVVIGHRLPFESKPRIPVCGPECEARVSADPYYPQWRQTPYPAATPDYTYWMAQQSATAVALPPRTPLGYPPMYGNSFIPMSPPYSPAPQPVLSMTPTLSPPPGLPALPTLEVRSLLFRPPPQYRFNNPFIELQSKAEMDAKRKTYASVVITDPKTGRTLDLKKLANEEEEETSTKESLDKQWPSVKEAEKHWPAITSAKSNVSASHSPTTNSGASTSHSMASVSELESFDDHPTRVKSSEEKPKINGHLTNGINDSEPLGDDDIYYSDDGEDKATKSEVSKQSERQTESVKTSH